jgi:iron complex outermembrane receptor protein
MKKIFLLTFCLFTHTIFGQTGQLNGIVFNGAGEPAPFVSVQVKEIKKGVVSDESGAFSFSGLKANTYTLQASFVGYKTLEQIVTIEEGKTLNLELELFENAEALKEIVVRGYLSQNDRIASIGKLVARPMDLPMAIQTIDRQVLEYQQVNSMQDVLMNTNGVYIMGNTGGYQEEIAGRGFSFGSNNTFKNGARFLNSMIPEVSSLEKVEVLKGSAAILFGNVSAGGIINLVTKKPKFGFGGELSVRTGSFGLIKPSFDVYGGIGKGEHVAFRINGTYQKANSFRQFVNSERFYINPSLLIRLGKKTDLLMEGDILDDSRMPDFGTGIVNYEVIKDYPRNRYLGVKWGFVNSKQASATATLTHRFTDNWKLAVTSTYRDSEQFLFSNVRPNRGGLIKSDGLWTRSIEKSETWDKYYIAQADLTGNFNTGSMKHQLLVGLDSDHYVQKSQTYDIFLNYDVIDVYKDLPENVRNDIPEMIKANYSNNPTDRFGIYIQDLVSLLPKVKALVGLRYSSQLTSSMVTETQGETFKTEQPLTTAFSPRLGLVYQPTENISAFISYANNFAVNTGIDILGNALPASIIGQYEAGIKNELFNGKASVNFIVYQIDDSNRAQTSIANGNTNRNIKELAGHIQSKGAELDITARPFQNLSFIAGYSYNKSVVVESNTLTIGSPIRYMPNHTANASFNYRLKNGIQLGVTSAYIGERFAGRDTPQTNNTDGRKPVPIPSYYQFDANLGYTYKLFTFRVKAANVLNKLSYNVHDDNSVNPIAPRNYSATLAYKF